MSRLPRWIAWIAVIAFFALIAVGGAILLSITLIWATVHDARAKVEKARRERARTLVEQMLSASLGYGTLRFANVPALYGPHWPSADERTAIEAIGEALKVPAAARSYAVHLPARSGSAVARTVESAQRLEGDLATLSEIADMLGGMRQEAGRQAVLRIAEERRTSR